MIIILVIAGVFVLVPFVLFLTLFVENILFLDCLTLSIICSAWISSFMGSCFWRDSGRVLLLPEEYELLSILKSLYGLSLEGACRPAIDLQGV